ncbi:hypothetical protein E2605_11845 [Dysgonomonas capnocytophagoides]|uniref:Uncharacterized protein n=1 Tax=Dysgonomonas capnocytophagoides TaxID=45254 RepID=A0A4Y8L201_9BACT|nr:hypothetical protein [Dysgonomonas capnocytophagoides]TFD95532.1 hypothetical protein E2605_11845 [Dysgonomonas capnocytophagoides]
MIQKLGNVGVSVGENSTLTFQMGDNPFVTPLMQRSDFVDSSLSAFGPFQWLNVNGYNIYARGANNMQCEEIEYDIKRNRLLPTLITKKVNMLYGRGLRGYRDEIGQDNKIIRKWHDEPSVFSHLESWTKNGIELPYQDFALALIKRYYTFGDFFVKNRMSQGNIIRYIGRTPIAGMELIENKYCRLAARKGFDPYREVPTYKDFDTILFGNWHNGVSNFSIYPRFNMSDVRNYKTAAIAHYRQDSVGEFYGRNETFEGTKTLLRLSNDLPEYLTSFLSNSLSAKVHLIIPDAWIASKRKQIQALCAENKKRKEDSKPLFTFSGKKIEIGSEYSESYLIEYIDYEIKQATKFLTGKKNQGKTFTSYSFRTANKDEERWRFETLDLKYSEYITSLITVDKRADEVLLSAFGLDASISAISQPGVISKSGADSYYNYIIYMLSLQPDEQVCMKPFNDYLTANFPSLYDSGYRLGCYREMPSRQEEVSVNDRLNTQQA